MVLNRMGMRALKALPALLAMGWVGMVGAQTADEIVEKNIKAIGSADAIAKIKSIHRTGEASLGGQFGEQSGTTEQVIVPGQKLFNAVDFDMGYQHTALVGDKGWVDGTMDGLSDMKPEQVRTARAQVNFNNPLIDYKKYGLEVKKLDDEKISLLDAAGTTPSAPATAAPATAGAAGTSGTATTAAPKPAAPTIDCYVLEVGPADGQKAKVYIDKKTNLLLQTRATQSNDQMGEVTITVQNEDYKDYEGLKLPSKVTLAMGEFMTIGMNYKKTEINGKIDEKIFEKPQPPAPAPGTTTAPPGATSSTPKTPPTSAK